MGHGGGHWSFMRDRSVTKQKLPPGTLRRIMRFAAPYRKILGIFLGVIVVDALIGVWNPLIYRQIIDGGIVKRDSRLIVLLGLLLAGLALADALLSLVQRYISSARRRGAHLRHAREGVRAHPADAARFLFQDPDRRPHLEVEQRRARRSAGLHRHAFVDREQSHHRRLHGHGDGVPLVADNRRALCSCFRCSCSRRGASGASSSN